MAYLSHGDAFHEMWDLTRSWAKYEADCTALAVFCMEQAAAGIPCIKYGASDYPMAKFVCAFQDDKPAPLLAQVFDAYVRHGLMDPNAVMVLSQETPPHYKVLRGDRPIDHAVIKGNLHAAELLVLHGANTADKVSDNVGGYLGEDFFDFVRLHFGETHHQRPTPSQRAAVAARLLEISLARQIDAASRAVMPSNAESVAPGGTARSRRGL